VALAAVPGAAVLDDVGVVGRGRPGGVEALTAVDVDDAEVPAAGVLEDLALIVAAVPGHCLISPLSTVDAPMTSITLPLLRLTTRYAAGEADVGGRLSLSTHE
jgi:hypothetical protein